MVFMMICMMSICPSKDKDESKGLLTISFSAIKVLIAFWCNQSI